MRFGLGYLGLAPAVFWGMTTSEFLAAQEGYLESKGVKLDEMIDASTARQRLDELMARYPDDPQPAPQ